MIKWGLIILAVIVGFAVWSGNMGGAKDAASNYNKVLRPQSNK